MMVKQHDTDVRYARQLCLPDIGVEGQAKISAGRVLVIGAGGLGSPVSLYLAAAGVGTIGIIDHDRVALSNLQRQILFETADVGRMKVDAAQDRLTELNDEVSIHIYPERLDQTNIADIIAGYDIIVDGCDSIETRYLVNRYCHLLSKPLVSAAIQGMEGQLSVFQSYLGAPHPCYQCLYGEMPPVDTMPSCSEAGILGAVAGVMGSLQAVEVLKLLTQKAQLISGRVLRYKALTGQMIYSQLPRDPHCDICTA